MLSPTEKERAERTSSEFDSRDGLLSDTKSDTRRPRDLEEQNSRLKLLNAFLAITLAVVSSYTLYLFIHQAPSNIADDIRLGTDYFGYVPRHLGYPLIWTMFDERDPYYVDDEAFATINSTEKAVKQLRDLEYTDFRKTAGNTTYVSGVDDQVHALRPHWDPTPDENGEKIITYTIRSFHQMHCVIVITDEYGHRVHGVKTIWTPRHIAHCINVLREAVMCLADSTVVSHTYEGDEHVGKDQKSYCRNYAALREWADDPVRAVKPGKRKHFSTGSD